MTTPNHNTSAMRQETSAEQRGLARLRERYQLDFDLFTREEWRRLSFLRWLAQTGRLEPEGHAPGPSTLHPDQTQGADIMTDSSTPHRFGQCLPPHRLRPLARQMAAAIGDGTPAPWAGFAWHGPVGRRSALPLSRPRPARAA
jgi:hypothetical protein